MRILVADDEADFACSVQKCLVQGGFETKVVTSGLAALEAAQTFAPHLVVLDVSMPDLSGHEVCRRLRARCAAPILMLSGRHDEDSVVHGLHVGADDYLGKPFRMAELLARVHALLRRAGGQVALAARGYRDEMLVVDPWRQRVEKRGQSVELSRNEFKLLAYLVERRGEIVPRQELLAVCRRAVNHPICSRM
jgi:DNA-binding response OmpR family regulator